MLFHEFILSPETGCSWLCMVPGQYLKKEIEYAVLCHMIHNNPAIGHRVVDKVSLKTRNKEEKE
jgi:hypothetical protein